MVSFIANIIEILAGGTALFVVWTQREKISAAFSVLLNYSFQISLADFKHWLEKLSEDIFIENDEYKNVRIALAHIYGKLRGNPRLNKHFGDKMLKRIRIMIDDIDNKKIVNQTEKISLYSEIKESLTTLEIENHNSKTKKYE